MRALVRAALVALGLFLASCANRPPTTPRDGRLVVVLGSSSAAGLGASTLGSSWAAIYAQHIRRTDARDGMWNLARPGFTTFSVLPACAPGEQRRRNPNTARNIDRALAAHPYAVLLSLPTNDTHAHIPVAEQQANYLRIKAAAEAAGVRLWVMSPQPRNFGRPARNELLRTREWLRTEFAPRYVDVWPDLVGPEDRLREDLDSGDGTHLNDVGHRLIAARVIAANVLERP